MVEKYRPIFRLIMVSQKSNKSFLWLVFFFHFFLRVRTVLLFLIRSLELNVRVYTSGKTKQTNRVFRKAVHKHWRHKTMTYLDRFAYYLIWENRLRCTLSVRILQPCGLFSFNSCAILLFVFLFRCGSHFHVSIKTSEQNRSHKM